MSFFGRFCRTCPEGPKASADICPARHCSVADNCPVPRSGTADNCPEFFLSDTPFADIAVNKRGAAAQRLLHFPVLTYIKLQAPVLVQGVFACNP